MTGRSAVEDGAAEDGASPTPTVDPSIVGECGDEPNGRSGPTPESRYGHEMRGRLTNALVTLLFLLLLGAALLLLQGEVQRAVSESGAVVTGTLNEIVARKTE